jgi:ABC-type amino acid transport substrate-binding protein
VLQALRRGQIDAALSMGIVGHHMITFSREAVRGEQNASFYSAQTRGAKAAQAPQPAFAKLRKSG